MDIAEILSIVLVAEVAFSYFCLRLLKFSGREAPQPKAKVIEFRKAS